MWRRTIFVHATWTFKERCVCKRTTSPKTNSIQRVRSKRTYSILKTAPTWAQLRKGLYTMATVISVRYLLLILAHQLSSFVSLTHKFCSSNVYVARERPSWWAKRKAQRKEAQTPQKAKPRTQIVPQPRPQNWREPAHRRHVVLEHVIVQHDVVTRQDVFQLAACQPGPGGGDVTQGPADKRLAVLQDEAAERNNNNDNKMRWMRCSFRTWFHSLSPRSLNVRT